MKFDWLKKYFGEKYDTKTSHWVYESKNVCSAVIPKNNINTFKYNPGDYVYARHRNDSWLKFHIISSPMQDSISISAKEMGDHKKFFSKLNKNSSIQLTKAVSTNYHRDENKEIVFIAKGVGIFPVLGILRDIKMSDEKQNSTLIYQNLSDVYESFKSELRLMNRSKWLRLIEVYSHIYPPRKGQKLTQVKGKITKTFLQRNLKKHQLEKSQFFISMHDKNNNIYHDLIKLGVKKDNITLVNV